MRTSLGTGVASCGCTACGEVFTSRTGFDRHQRHRDGTTACLDPAAAGLERKASGRWGYPAAVSPVYGDEAE